jgi:hypothetical protein
MSKVVNTFGLEHKGKIGGLILSKWKGQSVARAHQPSVSNPKTESQTANRTKMKSITRYASMVLAILRLGFYKVANKMSEYNVFVKNNIQYINSDGGMFNYDDLPKITFSRGNLSPATFFNAAVRNSEGTLVINLPIISNKDANNGNHQLNLVLFDNAEDVLYPYSNLALRSSPNALEIGLSPAQHVSAQSGELHAYLFFSDATTNDCSVCTYFVVS